MRLTHLQRRFPQGVPVSFWKSLRKSSDDTYQPGRLLDYRQNSEYQSAGTQIICDIDKTYLETEFESISRMVRIAFEDAKDKVTVAGAADFLELARWYSFFDETTVAEKMPRPLHFVSSSPPQLRSVLEEKLLMDRIDWTSATFKNQAYNLKMGRVDLLRQHVAYKTLAILSVVGRAAAGSRFVMIGDNAETDAYIYLGVKFLAERKLSSSGLNTYLEIAGVESTVAVQIHAEASRLVDGISVPHILIRSVPGYQTIDCPPLTSNIVYFTDYFDASLLLLQADLIDADSLWQLVRRFHNQHGYSLTNLCRRLRVARKNPSISDSFRKNIEQILNKTGLSEDKPEDSSIKTLRHVQEKREASGEDEILRNARIWIQMIRKMKEH